MSGRTILITGGSGKFGRLLVRHFLSQDDTVIATARSTFTLSDMNSAHADHGARFIGVACDLSEDHAAAELAEVLARDGLHPDCLVNNARSLSYLKIQDDGRVSRENFAGEFLLDVIVPYELTMALAGQDGGRLRRVVNIGSQYGSVAANPEIYDNPAIQSPLHYGVAKAALAHLTRELAVRLAPAGIQVNCIAFGGVEGRVDMEFRQRYAKLCPLGRMLNESEVPGPVDMLLSDHFTAMTGHVLAVDGGWTIW
jgi:NAD(P)-dependent dehydrogenase (short-subunit alcohol dehydrogenase family)